MNNLKIREIRLLSLALILVLFTGLICIQITEADNFRADKPGTALQMAKKRIGERGGTALQSS